MRKLTMGSLFAGIGGFDLGFERAGFETVWQVEIDPWCRKVLAKNFPNAERFDDVRTVGAHNLKRVDVICGGFPCQDISLSGFGAGLDGERSGLWREMLRIIGELRPLFVAIENVSALLSRGLVRVLCDLAGIGFDAEWECLQAGHFGAPHERERVFILAYPHEIHGQAGMGVEQDWPSPLFAGGDCPRFPIWLQAADSFAGMDDGISSRIYFDRVGAIGNAVVPQIPELYARRIAQLLSFATEGHESD